MSACIPRLRRIKLLAKLLSLRTSFLVCQGNGDQAVESIVSALRMGRMLDDQPVLTVYLVKVGCLNMACQNVPYVLERTKPSDAALVRLEKELRTIDLPRMLQQVLVAERVYTLALIAEMIDRKDQLLLRQPGVGSGYEHSLPERMPATFLFFPWMRQMYGRFLRTEALWISALDKPWPDLIDAVKDIDADSRDMFSEMLGPTLIRSVELSGKSIGMVRSARLAATIERYRRVKQKMPDSLREMTPEYIEAIPADPFTGEELRYKHNEKGYVVYSVGENRRDDGGAIQKSDEWVDFGVRVRFLDKQ